MRATGPLSACAAAGLLVVASQGCSGDSQSKGAGSSGGSETGGTSGAGGAGGAGGANGGSAPGGVGASAGAATGGSNAGGSVSTGGSPTGGAAGSAGSTAAGGTAGDGAAGATTDGGRSDDGGTGALGQGGGAGYTPCGRGCEDRGFTCCNDRCVNSMNDPYNCRTCGNVCPKATPTCSSGTCTALECDTPDTCPQLAAPIAPTCCGAECCLPGQLCCVVPGPVGANIGCQDPSENQGTCPRGCLDCSCAAPNTPIATPNGERPIAELAVGDLVYSVESNAVVVVPILAVRRTLVTWRHVVPRVTLANGAVLEISGRHPTAEGRLFSDIRAGDDLGGLAVQSVVRDVPYTYPFTHDILPASTTATYFAGGALIGSTLAAARGAAIHDITSLPQSFGGTSKSGCSPR